MGYLLHMGIKKIIQEEIDSFDWAKDIEEPIMVYRNDSIRLKFCGSSYSIYDDSIKQQMRKVFGSRVDNWFERNINGHRGIQEHGGQVTMYFQYHIDSNWGGITGYSWVWDDCGEDYMDLDHNLTPEEFMRVKIMGPT